MIDSKFLKNMVDSVNATVFVRDNYTIGVCYDETIMDSTINAYNADKPDDEITVYFYEVVDKPSQIFTKKFFDGMAEKLNKRIENS